MIEEELSTCLKSVVIYRVWPFENTIETSVPGTRPTTPKKFQSLMGSLQNKF
ncbi:TPA: hypothetical protein ACYSLJ_002989 [Salmonella enterica]